MKTKNYLLAVAIGLFTTYSCDNGTDLAEDSSNKAKLGKVGIQDASIQEQAYADYLGMNLLRIILISACFVWTCFIHGTDRSRTMSVEKDSILKTNTYLKDSIKISAVVSKEDAQHVIVRIENHGKKFIRIGRIYGLQTFIDNKWIYLIKAKKEYLSIPPNDVITIMYNLCVERIRNKSIGYTYSVNRKNRIKLDVYDNKKIIGKISCEFIVPVNMVWNNKDGLILIQYD